MGLLPLDKCLDKLPKFEMMAVTSHQTGLPLRQTYSKNNQLDFQIFDINVRSSQSGDTGHSRDPCRCLYWPICMTPNRFTVLTIFGATGDLVEKKIIPALYHLFSKGLITTQSIRILAFARRDFSHGKYREIIDHSLQTFGKIDLESVDLSEFYELFEYHRGQLDDRLAFVRLADRINSIQNDRQICAHKVFYLAIPTELYDQVISNIVSTQLQDICSSKVGISSKLIIEKPFGKNSATFLALDAKLKQLFPEEQIYRIDHYLGKSIVPRIIEFRKTQFPGKWNRDFIQSVTISTIEELGVENRGGFYDKVGALLDVGQNHLLELVAVLTMDLTGTDYQSQRAAMLNKLAILNEADIRRYTYRAQYTGYRQIANVQPNSQTETYFQTVAFLNDSTWLDVPFVLEAGKRCGLTKKEIVVHFRDGQQLVFDFRHNPRIFLDQREILSQEEQETAQYVAEYATLFHEAFNNQRENFVAFEEVLATWKYIDPIRTAWNKDLVPLHFYQPDDSRFLDTLKILEVSV